MQASQTPTLVPLAFAANGTKNTIPEASQIGITPGAASLNDGFPPLTFTPVAAGGVPPAGADFNGVLNLITASIRWAHGGGRYAFSSSFSSDANVAGYPQGAQLMSADLLGTWLSLNDSNTDNPDTGAGTKWIPTHSYGTTAIAGLTNANVTLTPAQAAKGKITLAGTLTGNVQIIFPTWLKDWSVTNNTTGAFTATCKTAAGAGVAIPQNASPTKVSGDGTNIVQAAENVASATNANHAAPLGQVAAIAGTARNLASFLGTQGASATWTADELLIKSALGGIAWQVANLNITVNLSNTGANGRIGSLTTSGIAAVYAAIGPSGVCGFAVDATSAKAPEVSTAALPAGYTWGSQLLGIVPVSGTANQFAPFNQMDRKVDWGGVNVLTGSSATGTSVARSSTSIPLNARYVSGFNQVGSTAASAISQQLAPTTIINAGAQYNTTNVAAGSSQALPFKSAVVTPQTIYQTASSTGGTPSFTIAVNSYEF